MSGSETLTPACWQELLTSELRCPVRVVYTRARKTPIQVRPLRGERRGGARALEVRMHSMFAAAPPDVHRAVASWIRSGRRAPRACAALDDWIAVGLGTLPPQKPPRESTAQGVHHDLARLALELVTSDFGAEFQGETRLPAVTWGRRGGKGIRHSLRLGSFDPDPGVVRIHPVLDSSAVPEFFVRYVLFHELLHAVHPPRRDAAQRWIHHGREFRRRERAYADHARALAWETEHIRALLTSARKGIPLELAPPMREARKPKRQDARPGFVSFVQRLLFAP